MSTEQSSIKSLAIFHNIHPGHIFAALLYLSIPTFLLAPKGIVPLFAICLVAIAYVYFRTGRTIPWPSKTTLFLLGAAHLWGLLSCLWSEDSLRVFLQWPKIFSISFIGLIFLQAMRNLTEEELRISRTAIISTFIITAFLTYVEMLPLFNFLNNVPSVYNKSIALLCLLVWPITGLLLSQKNNAFISIPLFLLIVLSIAEFSAGALAFLVGLICFVFSLWLKEKATRIIASLLLICTFSTPWLFQHVINVENVIFKMGINQSYSWNYRLHIYDFTSKKILSNLFLGYGLNSSNSEKFKNAKGLIVTATQQPTQVRIVDSVPLHPHNNFIQWWLELGAVGVFFIGLLLFSLLWRLKSTSALFYASVAGFTVSSAIISLVSFGAWQSWWLVTFWLSLISFNILWPQGGSRKL